MAKVYIKLDNQKRIISCEGGYTMSNIENVSEWLLIDEGVGDKYNLCQTHYFQKPLVDDDGIYQYKYVNGRVVERTADEMALDFVDPGVPEDAVTRLEAKLEAFLKYQGLTLKETSAGAFEVVKETFSVENPIIWQEGMTPVNNAFYRKEDGKIYVYMNGEWIEW